MTVLASTLKYGDESSRQVIKRYQIWNSKAPAATASATATRRIIVIHGGAWRDPNNTCADFDDFVEYFDEFNVSGDIMVYSIDYDLSTEQRGRFPDVLVEVLKALDTIRKDTSSDRDEFCICGHSVGCTFITQIFEYEGILASAGVPQSMVANLQLPMITKAVLLDGIFDIQALLEEYPSYSFFVTDEFGDEARAVELCNSVGKSDSAKPAQFPVSYKTLEEILVVHSFGDELLSVKQPDGFVRWLEANGVRDTVEKVYAEFGRHNDVYVNKNVAELIYRIL